MNIRQVCVLLLLNVAFGFIYTAKSQTIAVKTNLLYDVTTTMHVGVEYAFNPKWSLDISGSYNPWQFSNNSKLKHWAVNPELKYWMCEKFNGHFLGVHGLIGEYNIGNVKMLGLGKYRYEGSLYGGGFTYGYHFMLGKRWGLETSIGLGYLYLDYSKYYCEKCGDKIDDYAKNYFGPTKAAVSLIYLIK